MSGQVTITQLPNAAALTGAESVPIVQNGVTVQTTTGAISGAGALNYPFLTVGSTAGLTQARYLSATTGLSLTDNGAGSTLTINMTGAAASLNGASTGIIVKDSASTVTNRQLTVGAGMTISNGSGVSGNPVIGVNTNLQNLSSLSGTGLVTVNGSTFSQTSIQGTSNQISIANGTGVGGTPTVSLANDPILPGTGGTQLPSGTSAQRLGVNGVIRYNTDNANFEFYGNNTWQTVGTGSGNVTNVQGTTNQITVVNGNTVPIISIAQNPTLPGTGGVIVPSGNTAARPSSPTNGTIRYNTQLGVFEAYLNGAWATLAAGTGVTSVATGYGLSGGPITSTGTLTIDTAVTATLTDTQTLTNKTISGANNTVSVTNALTIGTGLSGTSYNGSSPITIAIDSTVVTTTGSQTLTNKTINGSNNTLTNIANSSLSNSSITLGTTNIALGGTSLAPAGLTSVTVTQDPVSALQLATKQYVDSIAQGLDAKASCVYGTTNNITLSGLGTQAGGDWASTLTAGDRILVKNQTSSQFNGIYIASSSTWARALDMDTWAEVPSSFVFIESGTTLSDTGWVTTANAGGTIDVTPMPWVQFSGAGTYTAGNGLTLTGTVFSLTAPV